MNIFDKNIFPLLFIKQRLFSFNIDSEPNFGSIEATQWFDSRLKRAYHYVEYGTGSSTYLAAKYKVPFICVDSDKFFLDKIKEKIILSHFYSEINQTYIYKNIGLTGQWGHPILAKSPSAARRKLFSQYSDPPKECLDLKFIPDFVLIDGRFRVSCALKMGRFLKDFYGWTILVDDYKDRPQYHILEKFLVLSNYVGRMAIFEKMQNISTVEIDKAILEYQLIPD